jgi:type IV secretory pathway TraG/TraD family ATPase VirD4
VERVSAQGANHVLEATVTGVVIGALTAIPAHLMLAARNLRWTWALAPTAVGAVAVWATEVEAWSVALLVGGLCSCRWAWLLERRDREAGGDARRRVRRAVGVGDTLARRSARRELRTGRLVADGGFLLGTDAKGLPVRLRFGGESGRHGLLLGASGSGKSNALVWTVSRHMEAGFGVVVIDMKADPALAARLRAEAERRRQPFNFWSLDGGHRWNPLQRGNRSELKDKLIATEEFTERHYQAMYERYLVNLFRTLEHKPAERHLRNVVRLLDPAALAMEARGVPDDTAAAEVSAYLARLSVDQVKHLAGLQDRLALLVEGGHGKWLMPFDEPDGELDLLRALRRGACVVFSLNSSRYGATAKLIGNMAVQDLKTVCGLREERPQLARPALVAVDEFSGLAGDQIAGLFQRARSAGLSLLLATQELADLRRVDEGFDEQIVGNVEYLLAGRQNNPHSAETVAAIAGTEEVWVHTFQTEEGPRSRRAQFGRESGIGTKHRGREFHVPPDEIKTLPVGRMLLVEKNPHRVTVVDVLPAEPAPTPRQRAA